MSAGCPITVLDYVIQISRLGWNLNIPRSNPTRATIFFKNLPLVGLTRATKRAVIETGKVDLDLTPRKIWSGIGSARAWAYHVSMQVKALKEVNLVGYSSGDDSGVGIRACFGICPARNA
jgi:hypothetical protein